MITAAAMLESAANILAAEALPEALAGEPIFQDPRGPRLWSRLAREIKPAIDPVLLGRGTRGAAFDVGGRALKITNDRSEAIASANVRDKPDPAGRVSRIDRVFWLRGQDLSAFAVLQELLETVPAGDPWIAFADLWPAWSRARQHAPIMPGQSGHFLQDCERAGLVTGSDPAWLAFKGWFTGLAQFLEEAGVQYHDFWRRNLMCRGTADPLTGSGYVVIDLGYSQSRETDVSIDVIARFKALG